MQRVCATKDDFCSILQKYIALKIGLNLVNSTFVPSTKSPVPGSNRIMEIGIDSFAAMMSGNEESAISDAVAMEQLLDRIVFADQVGLDYFGIGEHHRKGFLDSAPTLILAAAAALTKKIRLGTAVTVLSAADPVRVFQSHATLDLNDYDALFIEKLDLLLKIRDNETITWSGKFRPALRNQAIYPRPLQDPFPIWLGVGGTPESFVRAGTLGLPLMVAIIGGETHRFRPLVDLYREAGRRAGHAPEKLKVGLHSLAYVGASTEKAFEEFYPGYAAAMTKIGKERGWPPTTRAHFEAQAGPRGALLVGSAEDVATKILRHAEALGGISRVTFQLDTAELPHQKIKDCIGLMGNQLKPLLQ